MLSFRRSTTYEGAVFFKDDWHWSDTRRPRRLVISADGHSWLYARKGDISHQTRYHKRYAQLDPS